MESKTADGGGVLNLCDKMRSITQRLKHSRANKMGILCRSLFEKEKKSQLKLQISSRIFHSNAEQSTSTQVNLAILSETILSLNVYHFQ